MPHASHAIDRSATLPEVQATLGHDNIAHDIRRLACPAEHLQRADSILGVFLR
jgi:hypothetical protein